jgi:hypothetical protein
MKPFRLKFTYSIIMALKFLISPDYSHYLTVGICVSVVFSGGNLSKCWEWKLVRNFFFGRNSVLFNRSQATTLHGTVVVRVHRAQAVLPDRHGDIHFLLLLFQRGQCYYSKNFCRILLLLEKWRFPVKAMYNYLLLYLHIMYQLPIFTKITLP